MGLPNENDWSFASIRNHDADRADRLEGAGSADELLDALVHSARSSLEKGSIRFGVDGRGNDFGEPRAIVQFQVEPGVYDWFFNARTGYRAQYWKAPEDGQRFNNACVSALVETLPGNPQETAIVRRIEVVIDGDSREEHDTGQSDISPELFFRSLNSGESKLWICERRMGKDGHDPEHIGLPTLVASARGPKLAVPRWQFAQNPKTGEIGEGLRAPYPLAEHAWLDLKGAFLKRDGTADQQKNQELRASAIYNTGWT